MKCQPELTCIWFTDGPQELVSHCLFSLFRLHHPPFLNLFSSLVSSFIVFSFFFSSSLHIYNEKRSLREHHYDWKYQKKQIQRNYAGMTVAWRNIINRINSQLKGLRFVKRYECLHHLNNMFLTQACTWHGYTWASNCKSTTWN